MRRHRHNLSPDQHARLSAYLRERPALETIYRFKQRLSYLLLEKHKNQKKCRTLAARFLRSFAQLKGCGLAPLVALGNTLHAWREEIATCGASPATTASPKASPPKWKFSSARPMAFAIFNNYR
jgi:transposase